MGFDDSVFDSGLKDKTKETCKDLIGAYNYEDWDNLDNMETGKSMYNGYSLCYRMLYAINHVMLVGSCSRSVSQYQLERLKLHTRKDVLELTISEGEGKFYDDNEVKIIHHLQLTIAEIDAVWKEEEQMDSR